MPRHVHRCLLFTPLTQHEGWTGDEGLIIPRPEKALLRLTDQVAKEEGLGVSWPLLFPIVAGSGRLWTHQPRATHVHMLTHACTLTPTP